MPKQPHRTLPSLFSEFRRFGSFSNFNLNISKTEALNIAPSSPTMASLRSNYSFQWQTKGISYLGVTIPVNLSNLFSLNYAPLLTRLQKDMAEWGGSGHPPQAAISLPNHIHTDPQSLLCYPTFTFHSFYLEPGPI